MNDEPIDAAALLEGGRLMADNPATAITIEVHGSNDFTVRIGARYADRMTWEEMLGQIAELTHPRIARARFVMLTTEEHAVRHERLDLDAREVDLGKDLGEDDHEFDGEEF